MKQRAHTILWAVSQSLLAVAIAFGIVALTGCSRRTGRHTLHVLSTNDVHGSWFDSTYTGGKTRPSLLAVKYYVDSIRNAEGAENVLLLDVGDCLQGDNAPYYFNYVDTLSEHLFPRLVRYMGYDAVTLGNHDIETGHGVYDRIASQMKSYGIPFLAGNAIRTDDGKAYFQEYKVFRRAGMKVLVLGYDNANISAWLSGELWSGMTFESLVPFVQERVDAVKAKTRPDVVVVSVHSGTGAGDGKQLESQGLDLFKSLRGVDVLLCSHDHRQVTFSNDSICLVNSGSHSKYLGHAVVSVDFQRGKAVSRSIGASLVRVDRAKADAAMREAFRPEYEAVKAFTLREVGELEREMHTRDAYTGMCDYINLIHTVQLEATGAQVSFAAPLTYNGTVRAGKVVYNDMFTIYPYENQLFVASLSGKEIKDYLESSYDMWIQTYDASHVLKIAPRDDARTASRGWSFVGRSYNFDSAAGLVYTVNVTRKAGDRVNIVSLADGTPFDPDHMYSVAMTSYRCSGHGWDSRVTQKLPEIREFVYRYFKSHGKVTPEMMGDGSLLGSWSFVPQPVASRAIGKDMELLFKK